MKTSYPRSHIIRDDCGARSFGAFRWYSLGLDVEEDVLQTTTEGRLGEPGQRARNLVTRW